MLTPSPANAARGRCVHQRGRMARIKTQPELAPCESMCRELALSELRVGTPGTWK